MIQRGCEKLGLAEPPKGFMRAIQDRDLGNPRAILNALEAAAVNGLPVDDAVDLFTPTLDEMRGVTR